MSVIRDGRVATPLMPYTLRLATEAAARAAYDWIGRGDRAQGDAAAIEAMEAELRRLPLAGTLVIGGPAGERQVLTTHHRRPQGG